MRIRKVLKMVDARRAQRRVIIHLECAHTLTIVDHAIGTHVLQEFQAHPEDTQMHCLHCPDITAPEQRRETTARELWKDAGEP